jgi:hypothetical protein
MRTPGFILAKAAVFSISRGLLGHRHVHGDEVRLLIDGVGIAGSFEAERFGAGLGEEGIVGHHPHAEGECALADFGADAARAEDAERLALDSSALERLPVPLAGGHRGVRGGHLARERAEHEEGQFRGGDRVAAGVFITTTPALRWRPRRPRCPRRRRRDQRRAIVSPPQ